MTEIQFIPQTEREFLASLTPPLAIAGARGRFSTLAQEALAKARAEGFGFIGDKGHPMTAAPKPKAEKKVSLVKVKPETTEKVTAPAQPSAPAVEVNASEVRAWAKANGHEVGERGRIRPEVIGAFLSSGGKPVGPKAKAVTPKPVKVRTQTVAYGRVRRGDLPKHISEPLLAITSCFSCKQGVAYCTHPAPIMPRWAGGEAAHLTKAEAK